MFNFGLIGVETLDGIEREVINKFFMLSIKHYANVKLEPNDRETFIEKTDVFFDAFGDNKLRWYRKMKTKFQNFDK